MATDIADKAAAKLLPLFTRLGVSGVITVPNAGYVVSSAGVTEAATTVAVTLVGPVEEAQRYATNGADSRVTATFFVDPQDLTVTLANAVRLTVDSRIWSVYETEPIVVQGVVVLYRLLVGEVGG